MAYRLGLVSFAVVALAAVYGCRSAGSRGRSSDREVASHGITDLRSERGPETPEALSARALSLATTPDDKARAYLSLGRAQLKLGRAQDALKSFYEARRLAYDGDLSPAIHQALGDAYFDIGDYNLARRYLGKAAVEGIANDRDVLYAKLVMCCRAVEDIDAATEYRNRLGHPISEEARSILAAEAWLKNSYRSSGSSQGSPLTYRPSPKPPTTISRSDTEDKLRVYSRTSWSARSPRNNIEPMGRVDKITVHHSGGDNIWSSSTADTADEIRKIQRYHQNDKGWADIGYHYVVDRSGAIWQGRKLRYQGAHARGSANEGNVGIVLLGNYMHQSLTQAQKGSLETLIETLCEHFSVPANRIYTHGEILDGKTECPGPEISRCVKEIREDVRRRLVAYRP